MQNTSFSNSVFIGLGALSWSATGLGFFKLAAGSDPLNAGTFIIGIVAAGLSAAIQILMVLFFFRATQPSQVSPTRWLFVFGCAVCMLTSITFGVSSYKSYLGVGKAQELTTLAQDADIVAGVQAAVLAQLDREAAVIEQIAESTQQIAAEEGASSCGPICTGYEDLVQEAENAVTSLRTKIRTLQQSWIAVQEVSDEERASAIRAHQRELANVAATSATLAFADRASAVIANPDTPRNGSDKATKLRAQRFMAQLEKAVALKNSTPLEIALLPPPAQKGAVAEVKQAMDTVTKVATGRIAELSGEEIGAVFLAAMIDIFIVMVMIWKVQETARTEEVYASIHKTYQGGLPLVDRLAQDAGFEGAVEAVNTMEANGHDALWMPGLFGYVVKAPVPRVSNKLNDLMVNFKNAGMARRLPIKTRVAAEATPKEEQKQERLYWVSAGSWRELQATKTMVISTPKLSAQMTFGEFVDWVCNLPEQGRTAGSAKTIRSTIARHFAFSWSINLNQMTHQRVEDLLEGFNRTATVSEQTKKRYRRMFQDMLALAAHKGLLPHEHHNVELKLAA